MPRDDHEDMVVEVLDGEEEQKKEEQKNNDNERHWHHEAMVVEGSGGVEEEKKKKKNDDNNDRFPSDDHEDMVGVVYTSDDAHELADAELDDSDPI